MKRNLKIGLAVILISGSVAPSILAAETSSTAVKSLVSSKKEAKEEDKPFVEKINVESLSLEDAINYGLNSDYSLMELDYTLDSLKITEDKLEDSYDEIESRLESAKSENSNLQQQLNSSTNDTITIDIEKEINDLITSLDGINVDLDDVGGVPTTPSPSEGLSSTISYLTQFLNSLNIYIDEYEKYQQGQLLREKIALVQNQIYTLQNTLTELENSLDDLDLNQTTIFNNKVQVREGMKANITSGFISLIMLQEQINFSKQSLLTQQSQIESMKRKFDLGLISYREFEKETRNVSDLEIQISELEKQLKNEKASFALTIGIKYDEDYILETPELGELNLIKQKTPTTELIDNSFNMISARTNVRIAEDNLEEVEESNESTRDDEKLAEIDVELAKLKLEALEVDLEKAINNVYFQAQQTYQTLKSAERDLEEAKLDNTDLQLYFELGLLSKHEFDSANISVKQAEFNLNNAKYQYYLTTKQVELLEAGVIPVQ